MRKASRRLVVFARALLVVPLAMACAGKSDDDGQGANGPVPEAQFAERAADAICGNVQSCCTAAGFPYDAAGCRSFVRLALEESTRDNGGLAVSWDAAAAGRCLDAYQAVSAACDLRAADVGGACGEIYVGTLGEGAACLESVECADIAGSEAFCSYDDFGETGHCTPDESSAGVHGTLGQPCDGSCDDRSSGVSSCVGFSSGGVATATCYSSDGLECDFATSTCTALPGLGAPCSSYCARGAYCRYELDGVCAPTVADGAACELDEECSEGDCSGGVCGPASIASGPICSGAGASSG